MSHNYDFENYHLLKEEYKRLKRLSKVESKPYSENFDELIRARLAEPEDIDFQRVMISDKGRAYLQYKKRRFNEKWIPVIISNVIAGIALLISIVSIAMQL